MRNAQIETIDALVSGHGSIYLVRPLTVAAKTWVKKNVQGDTQFFGGSLSVEHRYILDLIDGMQAAGLEVKQGY